MKISSTKNVVYLYFLKNNLICCYFQFHTFSVVNYHVPGLTEQYSYTSYVHPTMNIHLCSDVDVMPENTLLGCTWTMSHDISTHKQLSIAQHHIMTVSASFHHHTTTTGDNNNNDEGLDNAFASSGPLGKFFFLFLTIQLILSIYYRSYQ